MRPRSAMAVRRWLAALAAACLGVAAQPAARAADDDVAVRLYAKDPERLRLELEKAGQLVVAQSPGRSLDLVAPRERLEGILGAHLEEIEAVEPLELRDLFRSLSDYKTPAQVSAFLDRVESAWPRVATKFDLTPEGLFEGQHLLAMRLAEGAGAAKPTMLFTCQIHAGEVMTTEVCLDLVEYLASRSATDPEVAFWLSQVEVWVVPMVNPDGVAYGMANQVHWRKNRNPTCPADLNRNFALTWDACDGATTVCADQVYRGPAPASEPETRALQALQAQLRPSYLIDYHSFGERITYPGGCGPVADDAEFAEIAAGLRSVLQGDSGWPDYSTGRSATWYPISGSMRDECYGLYGTRGFVIELNQDFVPDYAALRDLTVERQRAGWQYLLRRQTEIHLRGLVTEAGTGRTLRAAVTFFRNEPSAIPQATVTDYKGGYDLQVRGGEVGALEFVAEGHRALRVPVEVGSESVEIDAALESDEPAPNRPPVVSLAQAELTVDERSPVTLEASATDPDGDPLTFQWEQVAGPAVELSGAQTARASFVAPLVGADQELDFVVTASDGRATGQRVQRVQVRNAWDPTRYCSRTVPAAFAEPGSSGVRSAIEVRPELTIEAASAHLQIRGAAGSAAVEITAPSGQQCSTAIAFDATGAGAVDLSPFVGQSSRGQWLLWLLPGEGEGVLEGWTLELELAGVVAPEDADDCSFQCPDADGDGAYAAECGGTDCDDGSASVRPGVPDECNGRDDDCDGQTDEDCERVLETPVYSRLSGGGCSAPGTAPGVACWLLLLAALVRGKGRSR